MLNRTKQLLYITIRIVHVFVPQAKHHMELKKNCFADYEAHIRHQSK